MPHITRTIQHQTAISPLSNLINFTGCKMLYNKMQRNHWNASSWSNNFSYSFVVLQID